jgi:hypothetical protein
MHLIAPDMLADAKGLSPALCILGLAAGAALWLVGWRSHRFWVVLIITVLGGVFGLSQGPSLRAQPLVAAVLLAVAAGMLALALVRLVAFGAAGLAFLAAAQALGPPGEGAAVFFLAGGLMGLLLFRLWVMALTSLGGTLLIGHSLLCLLDRLGRMDAPAWAEGHGKLLNWVCGGLAVLGLGVQLFLNRHEGGKTGKDKSSKPAPPEPKESGPTSSWPWPFRKAG